MYPWGNDWQQGSANANGAAQSMADVAEHKGTSPFGTYDMVGNAWEWYDGPCSNGTLEVDGGDGGHQSDDCWIKGGSFGNRGAEYDCRFDGVGVRRDLRTNTVGIRCCSD